MQLPRTALTVALGAFAMLLILFGATLVQQRTAGGAVHVTAPIAGVFDDACVDTAAMPTVVGADVGAGDLAGDHVVAVVLGFIAALALAALALIARPALLARLRRMPTLLARPAPASGWGSIALAALAGQRRAVVLRV